MAVTRPWIEGLRPVTGSFVLIGLRWLLWILTALPGVMAGAAGMAEDGARRPFFTEAARPFPIIELSEWLRDLPGGMFGLLLAGAGLAWLGNQLLTATAVEVFGRSRAEPARVWRTLFDSATRCFWPFLRIAVLAALWAALGSRVLSFVFDRLWQHAKLAGWTGETVIVTLPRTYALLWLLWMSLVGACALWGRVIVAADRRRRVRRLLGIVPRLGWRKPFGGVLLHMLTGNASLLLGAVVLAAWRQSGTTAPGWWIGLWAVVLLLQSCVWHWRLRVCRLMWDDPRLADLRAVPDEPWRWLRRLIRRRGVRSETPTFVPEDVRGQTPR